MQIAEHRTELNTNWQDLLHRQASTTRTQIFLQRGPLNKTHYQVPMLVFIKIIKNGWEVGMHQIGKHEGFTLECSRCFAHFMGTHALYTHRLNSYQPSTKLVVLRFIDFGKTACTNLGNNTVALLEQNTLSGRTLRRSLWHCRHDGKGDGDIKLQGMTAHNTELCMKQISSSTLQAVEMGV